MATVYTPTPVKLVSATLPADTDAKSAASVNTPLQGALDGVAFIQQNTEPIAMAALVAIAAPADGAVRHVHGFGMYVFRTSGTAGLYPFRVAATDATPGGWVSSTAHEPTLVRQLPVSTRVRGITNGGSGGPAAPDVINSTSLNFSPMANTDVIFGATSFASRIVNTGASTNYAFLVDIHAEMVDGATLDGATLRFKPTGHGGLPARQPQFAIVRSSNLRVIGNLLSTTNGFAVLAAPNVGAYDAEQALVFTPDQNNVIDRTAYHYAAIITNEGGTNAGAGGLGIVGSSYGAIELSFSAIPDARRA